MLALSMLVNLIVLIPVCTALVMGTSNISALYGGPSPALGILLSIYIAIAACSAFVLGLLVWGHASAVSMGVWLIVLQIVYKTLTVLFVGSAHTVVQVNLLVVALHCATLAAVMTRP